MQIKGERYQVAYDLESHTIFCGGRFDFRGKEGYENVAALFERVTDMNNSPDIILDIRELEFLNSSGITTLGGFIINLRKKEGMCLTVRCSGRHSWQKRSMPTLERFMPGRLKLTFES